MIKVKIAMGKRWEEIRYEKGMRVRDVLKKFKYHPASVLVKLNGLSADVDEELEDGDELIFIPVVGGG
jgi:sulfur carrier protein ThiS